MRQLIGYLLILGICVVLCGPHLWWALFLAVLAYLHLQTVAAKDSKNTTGDKGVGKQGKQGKQGKS